MLKVTGMRAGRACSTTARAASRRSRSTREVGLQLKISWPPGGIWSRASPTCGPQSKRFAAVRNIAPSVPCGEPTASVRGNVLRTQSWKRLLSCGESGFAISRWLMTTSIP